MKIGVMGAGAVGCFVGGRLAALVNTPGAPGADDVIFVGREPAMRDLDRLGLTLIENGVTQHVARVRTATDPAALRGCDVVLVTVKSGQTDAVGQGLARALSLAPDSGRRTTSRADSGADSQDGPVVVSLQNGMNNADRLKAHLPRVLGGVVGFNVVSESQNGRPATFRRTTTGPVCIEASSFSAAGALVSRLTRAGFDVDVARDIRGVQWSKLVMNLNNAVSALTDAPTVQLIFEPRYRKIVAAIMQEAITIFARADVEPVRLGPLPVRWFPRVLGLPTPALKVVARAQIKIDPEARSSMWEDLQRHRPTEVDEFNGEIVRLASSVGARAPLNSRVVDLVRAAEARKLGSPRLSAEALWAALQE